MNKLFLIPTHLGLVLTDDDGRSRWPAASDQRKCRRTEEYVTTDWDRARWTVCVRSLYFLLLSHQGSLQWILYKLLSNTSSSLAPTSCMSSFTTSKYLLWSSPFSFSWPLHLRHVSVHIVTIPTLLSQSWLSSLLSKPSSFNVPLMCFPNLVLPCHYHGKP